MVVAVKNGAITPDEKKIYTDYAIEKHQDMELSEIMIEVDDDNVILHCFSEGSGEDVLKLKRIPGYGG